MRILSVSYHDDNFGDMLIRICFKQILEVVLKNLGYKPGEYFIEDMHLKAIETEKIQNSDMVFFAGGGLFGLSYLGFYDSVKKILDVAEESSIPVYFSSVGVNNMDLTEENGHLLRNLLDNEMIKSIAVREDEETFRKFISDERLKIVRVCDPAVWAGKIFHGNLMNDSRLPAAAEVGINVVRGGLFESNGVKWNEKDEMEYLRSIHHVLTENMISHRFFTNGSKADNAMLRKFAAENNIDDAQISICHSSYDLIKNIYSFRIVFAIRMHASIIAYAMGKPSVNLVWNPKIRLFYSYINKADRAIATDSWNSEMLMNKLESLQNDTSCVADGEYLMTLYDYLFDIMLDKSDRSATKYSFDEVVRVLQEGQVPDSEEITDLKFKMELLEKKLILETENAKEANNRLIAERKNSRKEKEKLKNTITKMKNSKSWRYTAFLRRKQ